MLAKNIFFKFTTLLFLAGCSSDKNVLSGNILQRSRRQLLFPNSTLLQFNFGMGTPTPLKTINVNWAIQTNFQLPWNRSQIPLDILEANAGYVGQARRKRDLSDETEVREGDYENDAKLYHFYKYVEDILSGYGHNGTSCVLRTLCQLGAEPLHTDDDEDLLHEIAKYVLTPTNDIAGRLTKKDEAYPYIEAFKRGEKSKDCTQIYYDCTISFVDIFTRVREVS